MPSRDAVSRSNTTSCLQAVVLLVAVDVHELRQASQLGLARVGAQVLSSARFSLCSVYWYCALLGAASDAQILHRLQVQSAPGNLRQLRTQPGDHLIGAHLALARAA